MRESADDLSKSHKADVYRKQLDLHYDTCSRFIA